MKRVSAVALSLALVPAHLAGAALALAHTVAPTTIAPVACSSHTSPYGTLSVCPGTAPAGSEVTVRARGCRGASLVFLGPLDYIGAGGAGERLGVAVTAKPGTEFKATFVLPASYAAGGNLNAAVPVVAGGHYRFGSYPGNECSVPLTVTAPPGTRTVVYKPFTASGRAPGLHVVARLSGTCLEGATPVELRLYYRCFGSPAKNTSGHSFVFDPCFVSPQGTSRLPVPLICPTDPATGAVVLFSATAVTRGPGAGPLGGARPARPAAAAAHDLEPWALQLSDGQVCDLVQAAWGGLGPYSCKPGPNGAAPGAAADCHPPDSSHPTWTVECQAEQTGTSPFRRTGVKTAWF